MHSADQQAYWNRVADQKTFTHPLALDLLGQWVGKDARIIDYGCGYGRLVRTLNEAGFSNVLGFDTSAGLVRRGNAADYLGLEYIRDVHSLPVADASVDCVLLFAVLTCIPSNAEQQELIDVLFCKLRPGGVIYLSDYYLQDDRSETGDYQYSDGDSEAYGVFTLPEGATFRHHEPAWIEKLTSCFLRRAERDIEVQTMNGHTARAFQLILQKV